MVTKNYVKVSFEECKGCRLCLRACPNECMHMGSKINRIGYQYIEFKPGRCVACGICYYVCPEPGALTVIKVDQGVDHHE